MLLACDLVRPDDDSIHPAGDKISFTADFERLRGIVKRYISPVWDGRSGFGNKQTSIDLPRKRSAFLE